MFSRFQFGAPGSDRGFQALLGLILLAILIPTGCLLYFLNEAIHSQRNLARQQIGDAYRGQLRLIKERVDSFWQERERRLDEFNDSELPSIFFEHCVRDGLADSVICLNADGSPAYPSLASVPQSDPTLQDPRWIEARRLEDTGKPVPAADKYREIADTEKDPSATARALQGVIRCLVVAGRRSAAIDLIEDLSEKWRMSYATGLDGRNILADEYRLEMQLLSDNDGRLANVAQRIFSVAQNYSRPMPSAQRLFLMDHLRGFAPQQRFRTFPTYQAERLAERVLSTGHASAGAAGLQLSGIGDVWKLTTARRRIIALYSTLTLTRSIDSLLGKEYRFTLPGQPAPPDSMPLSASLPGWQVSVRNPAAILSSMGASRQIASYVWIGMLTILTMAVLAGIVGQNLRRQMRIAHLKTDLVAAVSHELKTPLASMKLLVESLLGSEHLDPQRTREYLQMVARENSRLSRLIDNFLTFSRMERNRGKFEFARVQPESIVQAALESIGDRYAVELHVDSRLPPLYADEDALVTVLLNLLDNAYKYSSDNRRIVLSVRQEHGRVCFAVQDNGIGIAERDQKKIFRRFFQVDRHLARQAGGVGLGLSIVEYIVKAHHGEVSVSSRPGAGSTFTVSLAPSSSASGAAA